MVVPVDHLAVLLDRAGGVVQFDLELDRIIVQLLVAGVQAGL